MSTKSRQQPYPKQSEDFYKDVIVFRQNQGVWYVKGACKHDVLSSKPVL